MSKWQYDSLLECQALDVVYLHSPSKKDQESLLILQLLWKGLYIVIKQINDWVYRILLGPKAKSKVVHRNQL